VNLTKQALSMSVPDSGFLLPDIIASLLMIPTTVIYTAPALNWRPQNSVLGYFVGVLLAVLVLGALVALVTAFAAGVQWLGTLTEGGGRPETQIERTHPSTTAKGTRPTTTIEEETTTSITETPPPKPPPPESPPKPPPPESPPESPPTATAAATAQYAQYRFSRDLGDAGTAPSAKHPR
jgi:hypothetical protein